MFCSVRVTPPHSHEGNSPSLTLPGEIPFQRLTEVAYLLRGESESDSNRLLNIKQIYNHNETENQEPNSVIASHNSYILKVIHRDHWEAWPAIQCNILNSISPPSMSEQMCRTVLFHLWYTGEHQRWVGFHS